MHFSLICSLSEIHFAKHGAAMRMTNTTKITIFSPQKEPAQQKKMKMLLFDNRKNITDHRVRDDIENLDEKFDESDSNHTKGER